MIEKMGCSRITYHCHRRLWWSHCTTRGHVAASPAMSHPQLLPAYSGMSDGPDIDSHPHDKSSIWTDDLLDGSVTGQRSTDLKELVEVRRQGRSCTQCL